MMRQEHPNPQFERSTWENLNGEWDFEFDFGNSKLDSGILDRENWETKINVPFCPESELSGIGHKDFIPAVWYRRKINITAEQLDGRVILNFGAVDYYSEIFVNSKKVSSHMGGYSSFKIDITEYLSVGENTLVVHAVDDTRSPLQATGKQSIWYHSRGCHYTRTTGIWQTVFLEFVPKNYIKSVKFYPDYKNGTLTISAKVEGNGDFEAASYYDGKETGSFKRYADGVVKGEIQLSEIHLWEVGNGRLYDLVLKFGKDEVKSYFGLRNLKLDGNKFLINGKSVFQRLVLDQGFYPDGIYTAATDEALKHDVEISMAVGFNGARLHQKIFEPRFLYHCDKMGYIVWGEYPNWGLDFSDRRVLDKVSYEWAECVERDFNHPSIVGWCPMNETNTNGGREAHDDFLRFLYRFTKQLDETRPCIDTSGWKHVETDIYDTHNYEQNPDVFRESYKKLTEENIMFDGNNPHMEYVSGPVFVSEYGGIRWSVNEEEKAWGYGEAPKSKEELISRYKGLTDVLLDNEKMFGFCYTQLYDVEQEQNGLYCYDRTPKFDTEIFKKINSRKAAIEK